MSQDCRDIGLFGEMNKGDFLEAVYRKIKTLLDNGWQVKLHPFPDYIETDE